MTSVICDICKKAIPNADEDVNYHTLLDKTMASVQGRCDHEVPRR
jgi:hypothetical protein